MMQKVINLIQNPLRYPSIVVLAITVNLALFILIQTMVTNDRFRPPEIENINLVDFIRYQEEPKAPDEIVEEEILKEPPPPEEPPPPPEMQQPEPVEPQPVEMDMPTPNLDVPLSLQGQPYLGDFMKSTRPRPTRKTQPEKPKIVTDIVPTIKIPPDYPRRALRSGIEGVVTVEFTIDTGGNVQDPVIIEADPPKIFDRAVLKAIKKWKFNPEMKDGQPIEIRARQDVRFTLKK
ncbi:MAG: TonB family protein [Gammaproteobacteria bacterium]|nr:TonB family protein [Gammaproteobacteria bacterium]